MDGFVTIKSAKDYFLWYNMVRPFKENFSLASDEGAFHGGEATAPPPLALFTGGLTGCVMTQIRAFAKRL